MNKRYIALMIVLTLLISLFSTSMVSAQAQTVECGDIIESEFIQVQENQDYQIAINAGDSVTAFARPLGVDLELVAFILNPANMQIAGETSGTYGVYPEYTVESGILGANGNYTIRVTNQTWSGNSGGLGVYTLEISCTLRDGTVINAGESLEPVAEMPSGDTTTSQPAFTGFGFPGLAPVDMSNIARVPLPEGIPFTGAVTPTGNEIIGYTFDGTAGQLLNLNVERVSGNLSLGVVVIDSSSNMMYFSALVASDNVSTNLRIPADGGYVIGVFLLDLTPQPTPEATAFSVQIQSQ